VRRRRRFLVLAVGSASREAALRELTWKQIDLRRGIIRLNPEGRRQTKKRRATIKMCPTLLAEVSGWRREGEHVITYNGRPLASREFFDMLSEHSGVEGCPSAIRHTVRTWLAEYRGVIQREADVFMGHLEEGTSKTARRYIHLQPEYMQSVADAIEVLFAELAQLVTRAIAGRVPADQPRPEEIHCLPSACQAAKRDSCKYLIIWSGKRDSNPRPQPWQGCALPTELLPPRGEAEF